MASPAAAVRTWMTSTSRSIFRVGWPRTDKDRAAAMISSFFLHVHPAKVRPHSLRASYTLGLGLISVYLFFVLIVTGVALMFYYTPTPGDAYRSMKDLQFVVTFGTILRNMHRWAAHAMVAVVFFHMCRVFFTGAYKAPRQFNWVIGVLLLLLTLGLSFTGYLLPWDQLSFWAITVGSNMAGYAPWLGDTVKYLLLGGHVIGPGALLRFYVLHCVVLPGAALALVGVHFFRVRKDALSAPAAAAPPAIEETLAGRFPASTRSYGLMALTDRPAQPVVEADPEDEVMSWPHLLHRELLLLLAVLVVLHAVSLLFDAPLEDMADPTRTPNPAKAPWYFLGLQELVHYSAFIGGVLVPTVVVLLLLLTPYLDRDPRGVGVWFATERRRANWIFGVLASIAILLTLIGTFFRGPNWAWVWPWSG
ncbi:MAG TPA: cytochrome b N-terminal domain-containing protein [Vicinamibacterales bacterium]|nr:cytochrome b N-terminal domain-containing protein [Vicinamibacterales bacterium]